MLPLIGKCLSPRVLDFRLTMLFLTMGSRESDAWLCCCSYNSHAMNLQATMTWSTDERFQLVLLPSWCPPQTKFTTNRSMPLRLQQFDDSSIFEWLICSSAIPSPARKTSRCAKKPLGSRTSGYRSSRVFASTDFDSIFIVRQPRPLSQTAWR